MKNSRLASPLKLIAACALLTSAVSGFAATTWTPGSTCTDNAQCGAAGAASTAATGVNDAGTTSIATSVRGTAYATSASGFVGAKLYDYGGNQLGVLSGSETAASDPQHAMDNNGVTELISLKFTSAVSITSITTSYAGGDSDMSLLAYTGGVAGYDIGSYNLANKSIANLMSQGWTLVANVNGGASGATYGGLNAQGISSSWWIVSAYNSGYGGNQTGLDSSDDYVKVLSVAGNVKATPPGNKVPEPGSLALIGAAFCAALAARRRQTSKSV